MKPSLNVVAAGLAAFAAASASATDRHWSAENGASAPFNRPASWNPAPDSMSDVGNDKFIIDKGLDKVAAFAAGDDVEVKLLYVGHDAKGGCLDMSGGTLNIKEDLKIGRNSGSSGKVIVSGDDTRLNVSTAMYVGDSGNGELTISGGKVWAQFAVQMGISNVDGNFATINLNGGTLETAQVNASGTPTAVFNWNGGTLQHSGNSWDGGIFPANDNITINVLENGAFYESDRTESFNHPLSGEGAFTCRVNSGKTLTIAGAVDLKGGFRVESGNLKLSNLVRTKFREISVAQGCSLDLNGVSVTVASYSIDGVVQPEGEYTAHNGTITVDIRPDILWSAAAWYDPSDDATLTKDANGKVTGIQNKGTVGGDLNLGLRSSTKGGATVVDTAFNGRSALYFNDASGYKSNGYFPSGLPASGPRTLFVVAYGQSVGFLSVAQTGGDEEGRSLLLASDSFGKGYQIGRYNNNSWEKTKSEFSYDYAKPCVFFGRTLPGDNGWASVTSGILDVDGNEGGETKSFYMPTDKSGLRFKSYYGTFDIQNGYNADTSGYQGEALIFTNALTDAEMAEVNAYLKAKWLDASSEEPDDGSTESPDTRYWADSNGAEAPFNARESWDPMPKALEGLSLDTLVLNKGVDKTATIGPGDEVSVKALYVGWGTTNGTDMAAKYDRGGRLDVTGGTLSVTDHFRLGGGYSDKSNNVVNVTGGRVIAAKLRTSDCSNNEGNKSDILNVSGSGVFEIATGEAQLATYSGGETFVNVTDGGTFTGDQSLIIGYNGKASFTVDGGTVSVGAVTVGRSASSSGRLTIDSGTFAAGGSQLRIGERGSAVFTMNGGSLTANVALELNGSSESAADGTMFIFNGGRITVGQINTKTTLATATMIWNGGVLSCNGKADSWGGIFPASEYINVKVLGGGAIYETAAGSEAESETIAQPLSGSGAFTKRGGGTLNLTGALDLKGGFKVEGGTLNIGRGALARTTFNEISVGENSTLNLNGATVTVASYILNGVAQPEGTYGAHGGTIIVDLDAMSDTPQVDRLVVDGEVDLGGEIIAVDSVSGSGFATNGTVVVTGDVVVSVGSTWSVDVPTFDRLVLGPKSRLVVKGAGYLPRDKSINILPFTSLSGRFGSVVGEGGVPVNVMYEEDHVCARRAAGFTARIR